MSRTLWIACSLFIVYAATLPFHFTRGWDDAARRLSELSWNPLISAVTGRRVSIPDTVQNVMLFLPFGVAGALAMRRAVRYAAVRVGVVTLLGTALSVTVELLQLFTSDRVTSVSDVVTNTTGAAIGAIGAEISVRALQWQFPRARAIVADARAFYAALIALGVVMVSAWQPFDFRLDVGDMGGVARRLLRDPWQLAGFRDEAAALLQYALFAAALCHWLARQIAHPAFTAALIGAGAAVVLEASQLVVDSRMPAGADLVVRVLGVLTGVVVWQLWPRRASPWWWVAVVAIVSATAAAMQMWSPYQFAATRRAFSWLPFLPYYESNWFPILSHSIELLLLYFPIGFAIGYVSRHPRAAMAIAVALSAAIAVPVEYVQSWVVDRYPSVTDIVMSAAGGLAGAWAATRGLQAFQQIWNRPSAVVAVEQAAQPAQY